MAEVAAAYFSNTPVSPSDILTVIAQITASLQAVGQNGAGSVPAEEPQPEQKKASRAQIQKSVTPDALISFEDGKPYKTLRRHLSVKGLTPEQYREKWGLPKDYPMVAPSYSEQRKALAMQIGLGRKPGTPAPSKPAGRGRPKTAAKS